MIDNLLVWALGGMVLGAVLNRLRGMIGIMSFAAGAVIGGAAWLAGFELWQCVVLGALYVVGESWGWTKWINCITYDATHKPKGAGDPLTQAMYNRKWAYPKEVDAPNFEWLMQILEEGWDQRDYKTYVLVGMTIRGLLWWVPFFAALAYFTGNFYDFVPAVILGVLFPYAYKVAYDNDWGGWYYLQKAEVFYGAIYGLVLGLSFWWGISG